MFMSAWCGRRGTQMIRIVALAVMLTGASVGTAASAPADAGAPVVRNGGFETGTLAGWRTSELGNPGDGWTAGSGTRSPASGFLIPAPQSGKWQAVADQIGPGSHVLYQDIAVADGELGIALTLWYDNRNGAFFTPRTLSPVFQANQQLRVDIVRPGAPIRSMAPGDILATLFRTRVGDPASIAPRVLRQDLSRFEEQTVRLRIAEVDNQFFFQVGVDAVRVTEMDEGHAWPTGQVDTSQTQTAVTSGGSISADSDYSH